MGTTLLDQCRQTIFTHQLFTPRARLLVAVSGGPDSVALLHVLATLRKEWALTLHVAHLDHGLRDTSQGDAAFVRELGTAWQIPTAIERRDVRAICTRAGWSLEDGARRVRYQFLSEVAARYGAQCIALAHTADDQAETVLMRLLRGTGLMGLAAIPIKRGLEAVSWEQSREPRVWIVRPLLESWRREILAYLTEQRLAVREDATNTDRRFLRNRIRHELLPLLEREYNPNIKRTLTQLAEQSHWDYAYLHAAALRQWKRTVKVPHPSRRPPRSLRSRSGQSKAHLQEGANGMATKGSAPDEVRIALTGFLRQPKALQRQLVRQAIQWVRADVAQVEFRHWLEAERLFRTQPVGTRLDLPGGVQLRREDGWVTCLRVAGASSTIAE